MAARSHLCDPDGYLSNSLESSRVLSALNAVDAGPWYPYCGPFQMGIAVVGRVDGATSEFAPAVLDRWGVGSKGCNTGIVLGIAIEDRSMYLATGGGAKEYVSDAEAQAIIDRMKPLLRDNRVADALEQCVSDVLRVLNGEHVAESDWGSLLVYPLFGGIFCCIINADRRKRNRYLKVKRVLTEMERQAAQAKASKYHVESCAICLETFKDAPEPTRVLACGHTFPGM